MIRSPESCLRQRAAADVNLWRRSAGRRFRAIARQSRSGTRWSCHSEPSRGQSSYPRRVRHENLDLCKAWPTVEPMIKRLSGKWKRGLEWAHDLYRRPHNAMPEIRICQPPRCRVPKREGPFSSLLGGHRPIFRALISRRNPRPRSEKEDAPSKGASAERSVMPAIREVMISGPEGDGLDRLHDGFNGDVPHDHTCPCLLDQAQCCIHNQTGEAVTATRGFEL